MSKWQSIALKFPLRPMGRAVALDQFVEPADIWHGMWTGSLPALVRQQRRLGGKAIYDSRDVYMLSTDFATLGWPLRPIIVRAERHWARRVDRVLTVNESYADLLATQLGVARPAVVLNAPARWTPPDPLPDRIREATGVGPATAIVLYHGQFVDDRGIEQAMDAILDVPGSVLVLLGFGSRERRYRAAAATPAYKGRVHILPAVPPDDLLPWVASADVVVMAIQPSSTNHRYTTPQKLWEAIAAGVPVVASDLPGMAPVVRESHVGVVVNAADPGSIAAGIHEVLARPPRARAAQRLEVLRVAHDRYNWETQLETLFGLYATLVPGAPRPEIPATPFAVRADQLVRLASGPLVTLGRSRQGTSHAGAGKPSAAAPALAVVASRRGAVARARGVASRILIRAGLRERPAVDPIKSGLAAVQAGVDAGRGSDARRLADDLYAAYPDDRRVITRRSNLLAAAGDVTEALRLVQRLPAPDLRKHLGRADRLAGTLVETSPGWIPRIAGPARPMTPAPGTVLHLLKESAPELTNGFTMRSRYNLLAAREVGIAPVVVTSLGFPRRLGIDEFATEVEHDGIPHYRLDLGPAYPLDGPFDRILLDQSWLTAQVARRVAPSVIHASSGFRGDRFRARRHGAP